VWTVIDLCAEMKTSEVSVLIVVASYDGARFSLGGACAGESACARRWVAFHCHHDSKVSTGKFVFVVSRAILASLVGGSSI